VTDAMIKLHGPKGNIIYIRPSEITALTVEFIDTLPTTRLIVANIDFSFYVRESIAEVLAAIGESKS
jgi:hypothetical protein